MTELEKISKTYFELLSVQKFEEQDLDYDVFINQIPTLQLLATLGNSCVSVFDCYKKEHVFYSPNYNLLLGYKLDEILENKHFLDSKIHPTDFLPLMKNGISVLKFYYTFPAEDKKNYKLINEYRILNSDNIYVRVIEQHQILELTKNDSVWLSLSIVDLSPNQNQEEGFKSTLLNFKTGKIIPIEDISTQNEISVVLTQREKEILSLVKNGFLSKEIAEKLTISIHTVNTHRQRFLEKLNANNSIEAVSFALKLGLI